MICPNCQRENAEGARFCNHCGAALFERADRVIADSRQQIHDLEMPVPPELSDPKFMRDLGMEETAPTRTPAYSTADLKTNPNLGASAPIPFKGESLAPVVEAIFTRKSDDPSVPATPTWDTSPIDFTGFEQLVDSSYVPPTPNAKTGDTLQMPTLGSPAMRQSKDFRAHASNREEKQRQREEKHQQREFKKAQKREAREAAHAMKKIGGKDAAIAVEGVGVAAVATPSEPQAQTPTTDGSQATEPQTTPTPQPSTETAAPASPMNPTPPDDSSSTPTGAQPHPAAAAPKATSPRKRRIWIPIVIIAVIVAIAAAVGLTYYFQLWGGKVVPDVVGETEAVGRGQLESAGFTVRVVSVKSNETPGTVLLTDPSGGARAPEGGEVVMHVSIARTVPNVVGMNRDEAARLLDEDGFTRVEVVPQKSDEPENVVIGITPAPDTEAKASTPITITYAEPFVVPDVTGMTTGAAETAITDAGLTVKTIFTFTEDVPEGTALSTDPAAGTQVKGGSVVTLSVARSRRAQLVSATENFLAVGSSVRITGGGYPSGTYVINSVDSITYDGGDITSFTITATPFDTPWFSSAVNFGTPITISGSAQWGNDGTLLAVSPDIARIA